MTRLTPVEREARFLRGENDFVRNDKLRECFLRGREHGEWSAQSIASAMDWMRSGKSDGRGRRYDAPDGSRVLRALGVLSEHSRGVRRYREFILYTNACRLAAAMGADPVEVGI